MDLSEQESARAKELLLAEQAKERYTEKKELLREAAKDMDDFARAIVAELTGGNPDLSLEQSGRFAYGADSAAAAFGPRPRTQKLLRPDELHALLNEYRDALAKVRKIRQAEERRKRA
ncbi:MAG: hypothetical protein OXE53_18360 [Deltaproteobacteria bacterium]|nr:hypothetical protein [Deltaproteobacteria bacterium]